MRRVQIDINRDFICRHCGSYVSTARLLAGVDNRNHCPYCLWSRHLDLFEAGDRLSACKGLMRPVGLTVKRSNNKYARNSGGELMLVHLCTDCSRISINRIAADDIPEAVMEVYQVSLTGRNTPRQQISKDGIRLLGKESLELVSRQLFGQMGRLSLPQIPTYSTV